MQDSPNCIFSQGSDSAYTVAPLTYDSEAGEIIADLKVVVGSMKGATIVFESSTYLHVEFQSDVFRFIDDVEFVVDDAAKVVDVRSASRVGYYDFGVNRRRLEKIRQTWNQKKSTGKIGCYRWIQDVPAPPLTPPVHRYSSVESFPVYGLIYGVAGR